ncbi:uncharacterized protein LOC114716944 [Neltuma alba]|uniref:uncharacterized protein LOC114716944 n=1 Tax=Neltuma alba TaxID=207710 RepID=UPI0010A2EA1C|nr:uncharacterized protein LOC114716944 [Prosopis alba]
MATLQKFKLLAMQCGVVQSPTRSPRTSPLVQFQRRKTTLRMLLCRSTSSRSPRRRETTFQLKHVMDSSEEEDSGKDSMRRNSLKELFGSSLPNEEGGERQITEISESNKLPSREFHSFVGSINGLGSPKPGWTRFRYRSLLRKSWRPALVTIPEE